MANNNLNKSTNQFNIKESRASITQYLAAFTALLGALSMGTVLSFTSPGLPSMQNESIESDSPLSFNETYEFKTEFPKIDKMFLDKSDSQSISWIISVICLGGLIGSFIAGNIIDLIGHRKFLSFSSFLCIIGWLFISFAINLMMVILGRFITGLSVGFLSTSVSVYVVEISTIRSRGFLGCSFQGFITFGLLLNTVGGMFVDFRMLSLICCIPPALIILLIFLFPESPYFLVKKNREKDALNALKRLRSNSTNCNLELNQIKDQIQNAHIEADGDSSIDQESIINNLRSKGSTESIVNISKIVGDDNNNDKYDYNHNSAIIKDNKNIKLNESINKQSNSSFLKDLRFPHVYKPLLIGIMIMIFQQMCGSNGLFGTLQFILESAKLNQLNEQQAAFVVNFCFAIFAWSSTYTVNLFGRRTLLLFSSVGYTISYLMLGLFYLAKDQYTEITDKLNLVPLIGLIIFFFVHAIGFGSLAWFCINEFSISYRNQIASICTCVNWIMAFLVMKNFTILVELVDYSYTFFFFACIGILSFICVFAFVPETKDKTNKEIKRLFYSK